MSAKALPLFMSNVTPADCLLDMLETVTTKREFRVWADDLITFKHLLSAHDHRNLAHLGGARWCELDREAA